MLIPSLVEELHEAHAFLDESAGLQAVGGERARRLHALAIHREGRGGFLREIGDLGDARLHAVGHLRLSEAGVHFRVELRGALIRVELAERVEHTAAGMRGDPFRVRQIEHRLLAGLELHALMLGRQEA